MKVSIILTSYNRPRLVREAIASVRNQTYPDWELLVVDDNSNEETQMVLNHAIENDPRCRVINSGVQPADRMRTARYASCINLALPMTTGNLITYLTDDDIFTPDRLALMVQNFAAHPEVYVVYGQQRLVNLNPNGTTSSMGIRSSIGITRDPANHIDHNSVMHRRDCLDIVGYWDDGPQHWGGADGAFFQKLAQHWDFYPIEHITEEHRFHSNSIQGRITNGKPPYGDEMEPPPIDLKPSPFAGVPAFFYWQPQGQKNPALSHSVGSSGNRTIAPGPSSSGQSGAVLSPSPLGSSYSYWQPRSPGRPQGRHRYPHPKG